MFFRSKKNAGGTSSEGKRRGQPGKKDELTNFLQGCTRILVVFCLVLCAFIYSKIFVAKDTRSADKFSSGEDLVEAIALANIILPEYNNNFSDYEERLAERTIFARTPVKANNKEEEEEVEGQPAFDLNEKYNLVGILLDSQPRAIVEDLETKETIFLSEGDRLENAVLEDIQDKKVVFRYGGRTIELLP